MDRLRSIDVVIYLSSALLIQVLSVYINNVLVFGLSVTGINVFINSYGIVSIVIQINLDTGLNNITLPVAPIEESISISCSGNELPFVYENGALYIVSDRSCSAVISYIANVSYSNNTFTLDIATPYKVVLTIPRNILLISMPNNIVSIDERDSNTIITFLGPSTIIYTALPTATTPISIPIETQTQISTSMQISSSTIPTTSISSTTLTTMQGATTTVTQSPSLLYQYLIPLVIIIVIAVVAIAIVFILRK